MTSFDTPHCPHGKDARSCSECRPGSAALGLAQGDKPYPELFKHWITTVYASGMPDVPDEFTRADMAKAFDAGCARYNDLLQSWSECRKIIADQQKLLDEARSREYHSDLEREARGLQWPASPDQPGHFCGNKETHDFHVYVHDGKPYQCFGAQPWPIADVVCEGPKMPVITDEDIAAVAKERGLETYWPEYDSFVEGATWVRDLCGLLDHMS